MPNNTVISPVYPMLIQKYNTLIPDPNADVLHKINTIIDYLNQTGKLTNDVVDQWNKVMAWAMNDGLNTDVTNKINSMVADGTFSNLFNQYIAPSLGDIKTLQTVDKSNLTNALNEVNTLAKNNQTNVGTLSSLTTTAKSNLVAAINENQGKINTNTTAIGTLANLQTAHKTDLVSAVNDNVSSLSTKVSHGELILNVKDYGAIGDDTSHPLSSKYATLAAAQAVYPHATALTDEIDWCAIQGAVNALPDSHWFTSDIPKGGGKVFIPQGNYRLNKTVSLRNANGLIGAGRFSTRLVFTSTVTNGIQSNWYSGEGGSRGIQVEDLTIETAQTGLYLLSVARSTFKNLVIRGCSNLGLVSDDCVGNRFENIYAIANGSGLYISGATGAMNTTQWFKHIYCSHNTNSGLTLSGGANGVQGMSFDNIVCEYNNIGITVDGGTTSTNTFGNSFKNVWLEQNTTYAMQINSGVQTLLDNVYSDSTPILVSSADQTTFKDVKANITLQSSTGNRYFTGSYVGTLTDPDTTKTFKLDNLYTQVNNLYKKYNGTSDAGLLQNAGNYIKGSTDGIYSVTITGSGGLYYHGIFNFKNGVQNIATNLAGTLTVATNTAGTVTPSGGTAPYNYTVELLSSK